jgi:class 3 adenylate cyclase
MDDHVEESRLEELERRLRVLEEERALVSTVDEILEVALRDRLPLEGYLPHALEALARATGASAVAIRTYDESLELVSYAWPDGEAVAPLRDRMAAIATTTDERTPFDERSAERVILAQHLDVAGELFGTLAVALPPDAGIEHIDRVRGLLGAFAEVIDNQLAFVAIFRRKSIVARKLGDALMDPVLDRGIDAALVVLRETVSFDDLLLVVRDERDARGARLTYRIIQGGVLTHEAALSGEVSVDDFVRTHASDMIRGDARNLLAKLGITRFREEALISGVADRRLLGKIVVTSRRGELSTIDRDVLERFADSLRQRLVDHYREWRHLGLSFPHETVERLLREDDYADRRLAPREAEVAILFTDLSSFTRISEQVLREPELIAKLVDTWSRLAVDVVYELGGVFDKMVGDCIIALFGPPFFDLDPREACRRAARAAQRITALTRALNDGEAMPELRDIEPRLGVATGLHFGPVFVGRVGPNDNYTAFGSVMNNAARLQALATRDEILCMHSFVTALGEPHRFGDERRASVKNVAEPLRFRGLVG